MRRRQPAKIRTMLIRIDQRQLEKEAAERERTKCHVCNGTKYVSAGGGLCGTCTCHYCGGTGLKPYITAEHGVLEAIAESMKTQQPVKL